MGTRILAPLTGLLLAGMAVAAGAQFAGESVSLRAPSDNDVYAAGQHVEVLAPVVGDVVLAGQSVLVAGSVAHDVIAAGESVSVRAPVGDDVRVAARHASLQADIGGHLAAAGQEVTIDPTVSIGDWAWLAGQRLIVRGDIGGDLKAAGETIRIAGNIGGDAELLGGTVHIESSAVIGGDLTVHSEHEPTIDEGAQIAGQVVHLPSPERVRDEAAWGIPGRLFFAIAVSLALLVFYWLFPQFAQRVATTLRAEPLTSLGLGVATAAVTPLVVVVLAATGIGFLLALAVGAIYSVLLLLGYLAGLCALADLVARRTGHEMSWFARSLILVLTVTAVALVALIPVLGPLAILVLWLLGTGALAVEMYRLYAHAAKHPS